MTEEGVRVFSWTFTIFVTYIDFCQAYSGIGKYKLSGSIMTEEETYSGIVSIYVMHKRSLV